MARYSRRDRHRESLESREFPVLSLLIRESTAETSSSETPPTPPFGLLVQVEEGAPATGIAHAGAVNTFRIMANIDSRKRWVAAEFATIPSKP